MSTMTTGSPRRHKLTADEYRQMGEAGVLHPEARVELIEGELIDMAPIGSAHAATVEHLVDLLREAVGARAMVRTQQPIVLDRHSVPQPDIAVVVRRDDYYRRSHPHARDALLVVEVADTSVSFDRDVKARLYARAGVAELWVVDLVRRCVTRYASPRDGVYLDVSMGTPGERVGMSALAVSVDLSAVFPE